MARRAAFLLLAWTQASVSQAEGPLTLDRYRRLIALYREGDFESAAKSLAEYQRDWVQRATQEFAALGSDDPADLRAAALLHSETGAYLRAQNDWVRGDFHWNMARDLSALVESNPEDTSGRAFRSRWLLAAGYYYQGELEDSRAIAFLKHALRLSPKDAEIQLALGAVHEAVGALRRRGWPRYSAPSTNPRRMHDELRARSLGRHQISEAEGFYREATRLDPALVEARLRLGRVQEQLGEGEEAQKELTWVLEHTRDPYLLCMAQLFLGALHEQNEDWSKATEAYRQAVAAKPDWQVTHLALSHALQRAGARGEAESAIQAALRLNVQENSPYSGWWAYYLLRERLAALLNGFREEIRR